MILDRMDRWILLCINYDTWIEFLYLLNPSGVLRSNLDLKMGALIVYARNLNISKLLNGTI